MTTTIRKARDGWEAKTQIPMEGTRILLITTSKSSRGGVSTNAISCKAENGFLSWDLCGDFNKTLIHNRDARCTEKTVSAQHTAAMEKLADVLAEASAMYALKAAA